jgi:CheY-like chemotaxis protein
MNGIAKLLEGMGHETERANEAVVAMRVAQAFHKEMVLLDLDMPGPDVYELASRQSSNSAMCRQSSSH